ncbi:MAG: TRAP transporter small permease [Pseudomonadota bacterium]
MSGSGESVARASGTPSPDAAAIEALANAGVDIEGITPAQGSKVEHPIVRGIEAVSRAASVLAGALLVAATLVVCQMIFVRTVLRWNTIWQTEFVVYSATAAIFLGAAYVLSHRGHVGVDFVQAKLAGAVRRWVDRLALALGLLFCASMTYASWHYLYEAWDQEWRTETVWAIPLWIPILPMFVGFALLCLQYVAELIKLEGRMR